MSKKLLVLGANGMLGGSLLRYFTDNTNNEVLGTVRSKSAAKRLGAMGFNNVVTGVDVTNPILLEKALSDFQPDYNQATHVPCKAKSHQVVLKRKFLLLLYQRYYILKL